MPPLKQKIIFKKLFSSAFDQVCFLWPHEPRSRFFKQAKGIFSVIFLNSTEACNDTQKRQQSFFVTSGCHTPSSEALHFGRREKARNVPHSQKHRNEKRWKWNVCPLAQPLILKHLPAASKTEHEIKIKKSHESFYSCIVVDSSHLRTIHLKIIVLAVQSDKSPETGRS